MSLQALSRLAWAGRRLWVAGLAASALALAALVGGAGAAPEPPKKEKDEPKKEAPKESPRKDEPKKEDKKPADDIFPDLDDLLKDLPLDPAMVKMMREQMRRALQGMKEGGLNDEQMQRMREQMRQTLRQMRQFRLQPGGFPGAFPGGFPGFPGQGDGRLGARVVAPGPTLVDQLDLPRGQGLVIEDVRPDSAAAKAGIKPHDILLELNGKPVPSDARELVKMLQDVKPDTAVDAVVLRKGKKETIKGLKLPEVKQVAPGFPGGGGFPFPNVPLPPGGFQPGAFPGFPGGQGTTIINRNGDQFTAKSNQGNVTVVVTGKVTDGKAKVEGVEVTEGDKTTKYEGLDKVPEPHRARVKALAEMAEKGGGPLFEKKPLKKEF